MKNSYKVYTISFSLSNEQVYLQSPVRLSANSPLRTKASIMISKMESHAFKTLNKPTINRQYQELVRLGYNGVTILTETKIKKGRV